MKEKINLALKPVRFSSLRFLGELGSDWTMIEYCLSKLITQNILFSAYHEARTIKEMAAILGINEGLVMDEIEFLEDNGFMERVPNNKYLTNMLLHDLSENAFEQRHKVFSKYAALVCDKYLPLIKNQLSDVLKAGSISGKLYIPENDHNFLLWAIINYVCSKKFIISNETDNLSAHFVKRNDGGENIAFADLKNDHKLSFNNELYKYSFESVLSLKSNKGVPFYIWLCNTNYDDRMFDWSNIFHKDYVELYENIIATPNFFDSENQNIDLIVTSMNTEELLNLFPPIPEEFIKLNKELSDKIYEVSKSEYPEHKQDLCRAFYQNSLANGELLSRMLEQALSRGYLKPLTEQQKKSVNMIMFLK